MSARRMVRALIAKRNDKHQLFSVSLMVVQDKYCGRKNDLALHYVTMRKREITRVKHARHRHRHQALYARPVNERQ